MSVMRRLLGSVLTNLFRELFNRFTELEKHVVQDQQQAAGHQRRGLNTVPEGRMGRTEPDLSPYS